MDPSAVQVVLLVLLLLCIYIGDRRKKYEVNW